MRLLFALTATALFAAETQPTFTASHAKSDFKLSANPGAGPWKHVKPLPVAVDRDGKPATPGNAFEVRTLWTKDNIYFLFTCPYDTLTLKPSPSTTEETNKLWDWDVTEVFIGSDFEHINHYGEFQVSPQGEWVDLNINRDNPKGPGTGWTWNSGMKVAARIDKTKKIWYGEMMIPFKSFDQRPIKSGSEFRINIYRLTGEGEKSRVSTMWTPVLNRSHHTPEKFGRMVLGE